MTAEALSYLHGASQVPLLGETIGENLDRTVARFPDRDAVISVHQGVRQTWAEFHAAVTEIARGLLALGIEPGDRVGIWSPNNAEWVTLQYATAKVGAILVNVNPAYRTSELAYALAQSGVSTLVLAPRFRQADYLAMLDEVAGQVPTLQRRVVLGPEAPPGALRWDDLREAPARASVDQLREREALLQFDDPINIQYTSGTTGFPKGATLSHHNILNNGFFIGEGCRYDEADRVCIPVPLYHCFGMVLGNLACTTHGVALVYQPLRCPHVVHCRARAPALRRVRSRQPAHRDHGRLALPSRGHEEGPDGHAHGRGHHLLRHDRDQPGLLPERARRPHRQARLDRGAHPPARRGQGHRPRQRPRPAARRAGRAVHPRLPGDARVLGERRGDGGGDRPGGLDAHRRPGHRGRRRLRQHRRPHQGHGDQGRREHLPTRGRGVPVSAPRRQRRAGGRRARPEIRRGAVRLVPGPDRHLQDPPLLEIRGRLPDDRHGQDPEVQDAQSLHRRGRAGGRRTDRDRLSQGLDSIASPALGSGTSGYGPGGSGVAVSGEENTHAGVRVALELVGVNRSSSPQNMTLFTEIRSGRPPQ